MSKKNPNWADNADLYAYARELHAMGPEAMSIAEIARRLTWRCHCDPPITKSAVTGVINRRIKRGLTDFAARGTPIKRRYDEAGNRLPAVRVEEREERKREREAARNAPVEPPPEAVQKLVELLAARKKTLAEVAAAPFPTSPGGVEVTQHFAAPSSLGGFLAELASIAQEAPVPFVAPPREVRSAFLEPWHTQCRYLSGERPYVQCEAERLPGRSYCAEHQRLCAPDRRLREVEE